MANRQHLKFLKRCVYLGSNSLWNEWRKHNPDIIPDLSEANLFRTGLCGAYLWGVDFSRANLSEADFDGANLSEANLSKANLSKANLSKANLNGANLNGANLNGANLSKANLNGANLNGANLNGANLSSMDLSNLDFRNSTLGGANLCGTNLKGAKLEGANLKGANLSMVNISKADLRKAMFTPEGKPKGYGSFLDLSTCIGLETARFSEPNFLPNYLARAFEYAHKSNIPEERWPEFVGFTIKRIKVLRSLYADQQPPEQLIKVVGVITSELIKYLKKHPKAMYQISPRQFEELIAEILASYGWQIQLTPAIKDGGYDIFAISKDIEANVETSWIIECKKYARENKIGVDIVRAIYGIKSNLKVANALLATTSYFTKGAKAFKTSRYDVELKDYHNILEWINQYRPNPNGKLYIKDNRLIVPGED